MISPRCFSCVGSAAIRAVLPHSVRFGTPPAAEYAHAPLGTCNRSLSRPSSVSFFSSDSYRPNMEILVDPRKLSADRSKGGMLRPRQHQHQHQQQAPQSHQYRFVDRRRVKVQGGHGGKGSLSMLPLGRKHKLKPDGGHGGRGGNVIVVATSAPVTSSSSAVQSSRWMHANRSNDLAGVPHHVLAEKGSNGTSQQRHGRNGGNTLVHVPCGVVVKRVIVPAVPPDDVTPLNDTDDSGGVEFIHFSSEAELDAFEADESIRRSNIAAERSTNPTVEVIADLDLPGSYCVVAQGGRGGIGTCRYASRLGPVPPAQALIDNAKGLPGDVQHLELELKLIGDVGLVGMPNAGKSSILRALSRAQPKVAPYPFTTLHPIVGIVEYRDGFQVSMADIPGLLEGASEGRGCGHAFLRHIERTKALLYVLDASNPDPLHDLRVLVQELEAYDSTLMSSRPAILVANKVDLLQDRPDELLDLLLRLEDLSRSISLPCDHRVIGISAGASGHGLSELTIAIRNAVELPVAVELPTSLHDGAGDGIMATGAAPVA